MRFCPDCGRKNEADASFCVGCGKGLVGSDREQRKTVTIVFCDVVGSTTLGERLDPEPLRRVFARYFEAMRAVVEQHGGVTDKFIGDAVMAVFGVPRVHEDDALRAARAAAEMRDAVVVLNHELERELGARLEVRIGVNSGEVVAGTQERLVAGDTVNVAARLEQAAAPGEILLGAQTVRFARRALSVEKVGELELKGKSAPVTAYRLLEVRADLTPLPRSMDGPIVGRERELAALAQTWGRIRREGRCELVTIVGSAGVGKSRLVAEFLAGLEATVVSGRCLSYGEAISYWPIVEVLKQLNVSRPAPLLNPSVAQPLAVLLGQEGTSSPDEIAWAFRKRIEAAALEGPLVVVFDDIQWGEDVFLDLLEHLVFLSVGAPILLVCMARPELLERDRGWPGVLRLAPLQDAEAAELLQARSGQRTLNDDVRERILRAASGNPLFVEEMAAVVQHATAGEIEVPPTIQALLASRLDQLDGPERAVLEAGAIEGELFHVGALRALTPQETRLATRLTALVRKEFLRPDKAQFTGEEAFRFSHLLIRDAAYDGLPKAKRAVLHERFADWLETHDSSPDLVELDDLLGYHLEQAHRYLLQLGASDQHGLQVGARAAERLAQAGERALNRYDVSAAANLLARALALLPENHARRARLQLELGDALAELGDLQGAQTTLSDLISDSERVDESTRWAARLLFAAIDLGRSLTGTAAQAAALAAEAVRALTPPQDDAGLARAWRLAADAKNTVGDNNGSERAARNALLHARRAGNVRLATEMIYWLGRTTFYGQMPATDALTVCQELVDEASTPIQHAHASLWASAAQALAGDQTARSGVTAARNQLAERGLTVLHGGTAIAEAILAQLVGDWDEAEIILSNASRQLAQIGENGYRATVLALLAVTLCAKEQYSEAETLTTESATITAPDDTVNQALLPAIRAFLAARKGDTDTLQLEAEQSARIAEETALLINRGIVFTLIARAHQQAGDPRRAHEAATKALTSYQDKAAAAGIATATALLTEFRKPATHIKPR